MIKSLIAVHHFPPRYTGGAEWRSFRTAAALQNRGHQVKVICIESTTDDPSGGVRWTDETYQGLQVRRMFFNLAASPDPFRWSYHNPWIGDLVRDTLQEEQPDVFHLFSGYLITGSALEAALACQVPTVVSLTDFWFLCPRINLLRSDGRPDVAILNQPGPKPAVQCVRCLAEEQRRYRYAGKILPPLMDLFWKSHRQRIQKMDSRSRTLLGALNRTDAILSPSQFVRSVYIHAGIDANRIRYARQGVDLSSSKPLAPRKFSLPMRLGYIGQIASHKGVHVLIQAIRSLPDAPITLTVYGDATKFPPYSRKLERLIAGDPRIVMAKPYEREKMTEVYNSLDAVVVPSIWYENSPNVILEAFAYKVPVIASALGGMAELVDENRTGLLFQTGNAQDLARKLQSLLDQPEEIDRMRDQITPLKTVGEEIDDLVATYEQVVRANSRMMISA